MPWEAFLRGRPGIVGSAALYWSSPEIVVGWRPAARSRGTIDGSASKVF